MSLKVGCHVSIAGGLDRAVLRAEDIGCDTFQIFTGNPRGWSSKDIDGESAQKFISNLKVSRIGPVVAHMPYLPNFASPKEEVYEKSCEVLLRELKRCKTLEIPYLVTHLGSHLGKGRNEGIKRTILAIANAIDSADSDVMILLENTSGTKNSIGGTFEDIGEILDGIGRKERVGTCFDTCHAFAAGYDISTESGLIDTLSDYERLIGLENLKVIHLNDTKGECASRLDRHEHIGLGKIGNSGIKRIVNHPRLSSLPFILETPVDERRGDKENVSHVRELYEG